MAFRQGAAAKTRRSPEAIASWLRLVEKTAEGIDTESFDRARLRAGLGRIRQMTTSDPDEFLPELSALLAQAGVALVLLPHFPCAGVNGATFRTGRDKAALAMTIRGAWADIFWFSLFHELGHLLLHDRREVIIETESPAGSRSPREDAADAFARDSLIAPKEYARFVEVGEYSASAIKAFAGRIGVAPGIVVGRLQHDGRLKHAWQNDLRVRYRWAENVA